MILNKVHSKRVEIYSLFYIKNNVNQTLLVQLTLLVAPLGISDPNYFCRLSVRMSVRNRTNVAGQFSLAYNRLFRFYPRRLSVVFRPHERYRKILPRSGKYLYVRRIPDKYFRIRRNKPPPRYLYNKTSFRCTFQAPQ